VPTVDYLHLPHGAALPPTVPETAFKAVVLIEQDVSDDWRNAVSDWLVQSGCFYMMAWGRDCTLWHDAVDWASLVKNNYEIKSDDDLIMTTWHDDESLDEVLWFAGSCALHPCIELDRTLIIDINDASRRDFMINRFEKAIRG
jgi:hypothetical protein